MNNEITIAYVGLGSNLGDRAGNLLLAVRGLMEASFVIHKLSAIYETEPVGVEGHGNFLNMAAEIHLNNITPSQMMARMLRIEYLLGRKHKSLAQPRTVDLDLLLFDNYQCDTEFLTLPHPKMHLRRFVLIPMTEIAPHAVHPILQKDMQELLKTCEDDSKVHRWSPNSEMEIESPDAKVFLNSLIKEAN